MLTNVLKRIFTSIILLSILLIVIFSNHYIFIMLTIIFGLVICIEANNIFSKIIENYFIKHNATIGKYNIKLIIINIIIYCYVFLIFCYFSYEIYRSEGPIIFLYLISICFFTDIGGYIFGKVIGGKKLTKISPNKTVSGSVGSFIFCVIPLILFSNFSYLELEFNLHNVIISLLVSLISQLGDLFISYLKRKAKVKDTGYILPGHGGVLDRLDGIIFAVPASYFLLRLI